MVARSTKNIYLERMKIFDCKEMSNGQHVSRTKQFYALNFYLLIVKHSNTQLCSVLLVLIQTVYKVNAATTYSLQFSHKPRFF